MPIHLSSLDLIANTPIIKLQHLDTGSCSLYLKLENQNPGGSIKDRIGLSMIEAAERRGDIRPGATLVEGTAGNTGIGLALAAAQKGYRLILVIPDKMSREKIFNLKAMGAEVVLTRSDVPKGHPEHYQDMAAKIAADTPGGYFVNQFGNPDNPAAHMRSTAPEILRQMAEIGGVDTVVVGCGSGGTLTGLSQYFSEHSPRTELILADPAGSILAAYVNTGVVGTASGSWMVEGIGEASSPPPVADFSRIKQAYAITDRESFLTARALLRNEGIFSGSSTGTLVAAALKYCREQTSPKTVLTFACDTGNKYLSKLYNDDWMLDNGFIEREQYGDLRDLIVRPYSRRDTVVLTPADTLTTAYQRMKLYDISQIPVLDNGRVVGIVDESDVLLHVYGDEAHFGDAVSIAMTCDKLDILQVTSPIENLLAVFDRGHVAIVVDGESFLGLITRIDLLHWLRRRMDQS